MSKEYEQAARESARRSLHRMANRDVHFVAGYLIATVARELSPEQLAKLMSDIDAAFPSGWTDTGTFGYDEGRPYDPRD